MPENLEQQQLAEGYEQLGIDPFDSPIPGESLTSDPGNPRPFEKPPEFTNVENAMAFIFDHLTNDGSYEDVLQTMREGTPLDMLAQVYLTKGFQEGKWNPDLMLLLIEPTIYLLMWLASQVDIDFQLDSDGDDWDEEEDKIRTVMKEDIQKMNPEDIKGKMSSSLLSKVNEFESEEV
jgi:hypothetical protein